MTSTTISIPAQFCGPPRSSNGGYFCGLVAAQADGPVVVRLKAPPPLDTEMAVVMDGLAGRVVCGEREIAQVIPAQGELEPSPPIPKEEAAKISERGLEGSLVNHPFPTCFVCGPDREPGDGMRIFTGPNDDESLYAAVWYADPAWSSDGKVVDDAYVWSAMDCPSSGPAFAVALNPDSDIAYVLGTLEVRIVERPKVGAHYVVTCALDEDTGKLFRTRVSLYDDGKKLLATGAAVWVCVPRALFDGA